VHNLKNIIKLFKDWGIPIIAAIFIAMLINRFLLFKIFIPSESMSPTLEEGDQLFVTRVYNKDGIKRKDLMVFYSDELRALLIKRVIGLPGENIEIKDNGAVFINGEELDEPYVVNWSPKAGSFLVPEGHLLFLGDNRANSNDSRFWIEPYISTNNVRGRARIIVVPFNRFGLVR
jgi:signal peptidase I